MEANLQSLEACNRVRRSNRGRTDRKAIQMVPFGEVEASRVSADHPHPQRLFGDRFRALLAGGTVRLGVLGHHLGRRRRRHWRFMEEGKRKTFRKEN